MKVLIIEDEKDICYLLTSMLRQRNIHARFVNTLKEARLELEREAPELIFLDNHLPDGLGMDFISHIRERNEHTRIIMITAHDTPEDRQLAKQRNVDQFIGKPFTRESIFNTLSLLEALK